MAIRRAGKPDPDRTALAQHKEVRLPRGSSGTPGSILPVHSNTYVAVITDSSDLLHAFPTISYEMLTGSRPFRCRRWGPHEDRARRALTSPHLTSPPRPAARAAFGPPSRPAADPAPPPRHSAPLRRRVPTPRPRRPRSARAAGRRRLTHSRRQPRAAIAAAAAIVASPRPAAAHWLRNAAAPLPRGADWWEGGRRCAARHVGVESRPPRARAGGAGRGAPRGR